MLFDNNMKLIALVVLLVVLLQMLSKPEPIQNNGTVDIVDELMDDTDVNNIDAVIKDEDMIDDMLKPNDLKVTNSIGKTTITKSQLNDTTDAENTTSGDVMSGDVMSGDVTMQSSTGKTNSVLGNDLGQTGAAPIATGSSESSVTRGNMGLLAKENEKNLQDFKASELLPTEINKDWFETDFSHAQVSVNNDNLVVTDKYVIGVNTVGQSLKNPSYDLRAAPACPKFTVSPWNQSTIEPDFNIKNIMT